jgi:hypothetical protein
LSIKTFWCQLHTAEFLDGLGGICFEVALLYKPSKEASEKNHGSVHGRDCQAFGGPHVISEIGEIPRRHSIDDELLAVLLVEPEHELAKVTADGSKRVGSEVLRFQELDEKGSLPVSRTDSLKTLISPKQTLFWHVVGHL